MTELLNELQEIHVRRRDGKCQDDKQAWPCNTAIAWIKHAPDAPLSEMAQQGLDDADAAWREYRESQSQGEDGRLTFSHREPFIAGYLAALPEDQG